MSRKSSNNKQAVLIRFYFLVLLIGYMSPSGTAKSGLQGSAGVLHGPMWEYSVQTLGGSGWCLQLER